MPIWIVRIAFSCVTKRGQKNLGKDRLIVFQRKMLWEQVQRVGHQLLLRLEREEQTDNQGRNKDQPQSQFYCEACCLCRTLFCSCRAHW